MAAKQVFLAVILAIEFNQFINSMTFSSLTSLNQLPVVAINAASTTAAAAAAVDFVISTLRTVYAC